MARTSIAPFYLLLSLCFLGCTQTEWTEIGPENGWFLCEVPGEPKPFESLDDPTSPPGCEISGYGIIADKARYAVAFMTLPENLDAKIIAPFLVQFFRDNIMADFEKQEMEEEDICLNLFAGKKLVFRNAPKDGYGEIRVYTYRNYIIVFGAMTKAGREDFPRFFESLKISI